VTKGKTVVEFSGNAGQVRNAFGTEIRKYNVKGEEHFANASDPQIPARSPRWCAGSARCTIFIPRRRPGSLEVSAAWQPRNPAALYVY